MRATRPFIRGFTLVELMVTIAIVAILVAVGAPAFGRFIQSNKVRTETQRVAGLLALARNDAVSKNREVTVRTQVADGALTVDVYTGTGTSREFVQRSAGAVSGLAFGLGNAAIGGASSGTSSGTSSNSGVVFLANGRRKPPSGATSTDETSITVCNSAKTLGRKIEINSVGRIEVSAMSAPSSACL